MPRALSVLTESADETRVLGVSLAPLLVPGDVVSLSGDLGAGKTVFVQGIVTALGFTGHVTSPSFTLVQEYEARYPIVHVDVYRLDSFQEVLDLGFEELLDPGAILLVEWGEAVAPLLPNRYLQVDLRRGDPERTDERVITLVAHGGEWARKLEAMQTTAEALLGASSAGATTGSRFVEMDRLDTRDDMEPGR